MDYRDALSTVLPPPRDDEPASLRQDILDELADHLGCAYHRELLRGANPLEARRRVLKRFGDPAAVARRLWFDAMKGKIMAQRVVMATCLVVTLASLALVGVVFQRSVMSQRAFERAIAFEREKALSSQQEMLKQLHEMSEAIRNPRTPDWNPVKFRITEETPDGPPVLGCRIMIHQDNTADSGRSRTSDASGIADLGILHPGQYHFEVFRSWGEGSLGGSGRLSVEPGSQVNKLIVCPKTLLERVPVRIRCAWPADLEKEGLVLEAGFVINPVDRSDVSWRVLHRWTSELTARTSNTEHEEWEYSMTRPVLMGPGMALAEIFNQAAGFYFWAAQVPRGVQFQAAVLTTDVHAIDGPEPTLNWGRGSYRLTSLVVLRPIVPSDSKGGIRQFEVLAEGRPWSGGNQRQLRSDPPTAEELKTPQFPGGVTMVPAENLELPMDYWSRIGGSFNARPGQVNEWTIPLPDKLIQAVRKKVKAAKS
jgi:hypothetical protein